MSPRARCAVTSCDHTRSSHAHPSVPGACTRCSCSAFVERASAPKRTASAGTVAWGWYAVVVLATPQAGGSTPGLVLPNGALRAFWAVWWQGDPRREYSDPDELGFVVGARPVDEAVGAADSALRKHRGRFIYAVCIGEEWAVRAYREGAPQRRSSATDFDELAAEGRSMLGLDAGAEPVEVRAAWRAFLQKAHPDKGGEATDLAFCRKLYNAALAISERAAAAVVREDVAAGKAVVNRRRWKTNVRTVAQRVRAVCEELFRPLELDRCDPATLGGYCTVAALGLVHALREADILAELGAGWCSDVPHWWAEARPTKRAEPLIVDVTATQFWRKARVVVAEPGSGIAKRYDPRMREIPHDDRRVMQLSCDIEVLFSNLPRAWWRGGATMTPTQRRALERLTREATKHPWPSPSSLAALLRRLP